MVPRTLGHLVVGLGLVVVLDFGTIAQFPVAAHAQQPKYRAVEIACQGGKFIEAGRYQPKYDWHCARHPQMDAVGATKVIEHSGYAHSDDSPRCGDSQPDNVLMLRVIQAVAVYFSGDPKSAVTVQDLWNRANSAAIQSGGDLAKWWKSATGAGDRSSCDTVLIRVPVPAERVRLAEYRATDDPNDRAQQCGTSVVSAKAPGSVPSIANGRDGDKCHIGWSKWESLAVTRMKYKGNSQTLIGGVFKNWSHDRNRTAQLWAWYERDK